MAKLNSTIVQGSLRVTDEINASAIKVNGTNVLTSHQSVVNGGNTASFGSSVTVGTVGGTALTFTMPANPNSNTWRKIQLNDVDKLGTATSTNPLNIKAGSNMTITESGGTFTFAANYSTATQSANGLMSSTDKTRVDNMWTALNGSDSTKIDTIAEVYAFLEDYAQTTDLAAQLGTKITANSAITGAQKCKITYDSKGLVTGGADLAASDIPDLGAGKITSGTFDIARIPTGTTGSTVALGNHTHSYLPLSGGTITATGSSDNALNLKSATGSSYLKFSNSSGTVLGYLGVNSSKKPVFYDTAAHQLAYTSDIPTTLPASDVSAWAKASTKPSYNLDEVSDGTTRKLSNYVPFSGATSDVKLGEGVKLSVGFLDIYASSNSISRYITFRESTTASDLTGIRLFADGTDLIIKNVDSSGNLVTRETIATQEYVNNLGYTSNTGTVTGIKVGSSGSTLSPSNGVITIPAYPTKSSWNYDDQYVKLSGNQTIAGIKEFSDSINMANHPIGWYVQGPLEASISAQLYGANDNEIRLNIDSENHIFLNAQNGQIRFTASSVNIGGKEIATKEYVTGLGYTSNNGTVTKVSTGIGLTGGDVTTTGTIKAALVNETKSAIASTYTAAASGDKFYAVQADKNGKLGVRVPWTDNNTTYSNGTGLTLTGTTFSVSTANASTILNQLTTGSSVPQDDDYFISQYAGGGSTTTTYHRRPVSKLYNYMKGKMDSVYQAKGSYLSSVSINGTSGSSFTLNGSNLNVSSSDQTKISAAISALQTTAAGLSNSYAIDVTETDSNNANCYNKVFNDDVTGNIIETLNNYFVASITVGGSIPSGTHGVSYANSSAILAYIKTAGGTNVLLSNLKVGDTIFLRQVNLPDVWVTEVSGVGTSTLTIGFSVLEPFKLVWGAICDVPESFTPSSHSHGNITNSGTITSTAVTSATGVLVYDSNNKIQRATAANARAIIGAQAALTTQTAYTSKGSATKVPQITTNSLGQVTGITEVTITNTKTYKHYVVITNSSSASTQAGWQIIFTVYSNISTAFSVTTAIQALYNKPPTLASASHVAAYARSSTPLNIVTTEWSESLFLSRHILNAVTYSGNNITKFTIGVCEFILRAGNYTSTLTLGASPSEFTVSNLTISDTVVEC